MPHLILLRHTLEELAEKRPQSDINLQSRKNRSCQSNRRRQAFNHRQVMNWSTWYITSWKSTGKVNAASSSSFRLQWTRVSSWQHKTGHQPVWKTQHSHADSKQHFLLTRSRTRENSGVLRVFKGSAGLRVNCSSVRGGTCLMKKYLSGEETNRLSGRDLTNKHSF